MILNQETRLRFRTAREQRRMTQGQAAKAAKITQSSISFLERGSASVSEAVITKLAACLGIEFDPQGNAHTGPWQRWTSVYEASERTGIHHDELSEMAEAGNIPGAEKDGAGRWMIPNTFSPDALQTIVLDALLGLGNQYQSDNRKARRNLFTTEIELTQGIMVLHMERTGREPCNLTIKRRDQESLTTVSIDNLTDDTEAVINALRLHENEDAHSRPATHEITVESEGEWTLTWVQPQANTGWMEVMRPEQSDRPTRYPAQAGLWIMGPTVKAPNGASPIITVPEGEENTHVTIEAFATDGSHLLAGEKEIAPGSQERLPMRLRGGYEYALLIAATNPWVLDWTNADNPEPNPTGE